MNWHKWPEEKPPAEGYYLCWCVDHWDCGWEDQAKIVWFYKPLNAWDEDNRHDGELLVTHWAEIEPPAEPERGTGQ